MAQFDVVDMNGKKVSTVELSDAVFGITPNEKAVHEAVVNFLANQRQGTQNTKIRKEVRGRRQEALASEGHRPRSSGLHPRSAVDPRRWSLSAPSPVTTATASTRRSSAWLSCLLCLTRLSPAT